MTPYSDKWNPMKILVDTDIGSDIDDALALLLLLHLPDVEIVGVTTVYGNVDIRAKVAKKILDARGVEVPVIAGAAEPLLSTSPIWHSGTEGVGVLNTTETETSMDALGIESGADDFIVDTIRAQPSEIVLVCLGALTNLAKAIEKYPSICQDVKGVFFMGGGVTYRSPLPASLEAGTRYRAEPSHNVRCDVRAAQIVFQSDLAINVLTNDVTTQLWWDGPPVQKLMQASHPPEANLVGTLLKVWLNYRSLIFRQEVTGTCPHDPLTAAEAAGETFVTYSRGLMTVEPDATTVFVPCPDGRHRLGVTVDAKRFLSWMSPRLLGW
jgi:inosine-uridine nucleoside N-ribohydrolase